MLENGIDGAMSTLINIDQHGPDDVLQKMKARFSKWFAADASSAPRAAGGGSHLDTLGKAAIITQLIEVAAGAISFFGGRGGDKKKH